MQKKLMQTLEMTNAVAVGPVSEIHSESLLANSKQTRLKFLLNIQNSDSTVFFFPFNMDINNL